MTVAEKQQNVLNFKEFEALLLLLLLLLLFFFFFFFFFFLIYFYLFFFYKIKISIFGKLIGGFENFL